VPPADGAEVGKRLRHTFDDARLFYDWGGGLIWLALSSEDPKTDFVRSIIPHGRGHATLLRAPADLRAHACVFPPLDAPLHALTARVKAQFDPKRVLNPGRMYPDI
jgi:glycolate oxidase FAD binding subunit